MEVSQVGVRTRARAMAMVAEETADNAGAVKRRKVGNEKLRPPSSMLVQTESLDHEIYVKSVLEEDTSASCHASASLRSRGAPASCCSSSGSMEKPKVADLEEESVETETAARYNLDESESTPTSEFMAESGEPDSTMKQSTEMINSCRTILKAEKIPPQGELDEFFAVAQEDLNKRFEDKYNYDIVNDIPLKGRFEWIQLKPGK